MGFKNAKPGCRSGHVRAGKVILGTQWGAGERCLFLQNLVCLGQRLQTGGLQALLGKKMGLLSPIQCLRHLELVANT